MIAEFYLLPGVVGASVYDGVHNEFPFSFQICFEATIVGSYNSAH